MDLVSEGYFEYPANTFQDIRKLYNLDEPRQMEEAIDTLEEWIKKQNHFVKKSFSRAYLERTIIISKGSVERAKTRIDKTCTLRTLMPMLYFDFNTKEDLVAMTSSFQYVPLPKFAEDYNRVFMLKLYADSAPTCLTNMYRLIVIIWEYLRANDYFNGVIFVADIRDMNIIDFVRGINLYELRQLSTLVMEGFGARFKGIHLISPSTAIDVCVALIKQVVPTKIGGRIVVHKNMESLQKCIPINILPLEYGGDERSMDKLVDAWLDVLSSKQHVEYMKEIKSFVTDEKCRQGDQFNEEYLGMPGTFRLLRVD